MTRLLLVGGIIFILSGCRTGDLATSPKNSGKICEENTSRRANLEFKESDHYLPWEKDKSFRISSYPGYYSHTGKQKHAWDFVMPTGTPIIATVDGFIRKVQFSKKAPIRAGSWAADNSNYVILYWADGSRRESIYLHLSAIEVKEGDFVKRGSVLGESGCTGWCSGPHLHYQVQEGPECHLLRDESYYQQSIPLNFSEEIPKQFVEVTSKNQIGETTAGNDKVPPSSPDKPEKPGTPAEPQKPNTNKCHCLMNPCRLNQIYSFKSGGKVEWTNLVNIGSVSPQDTLRVIKTDKPNGSSNALVAKVSIIANGVNGWVLVSDLSDACF